MRDHVGRAMPRVEDQRFLTGAGRFGDDVEVPGSVHAVLLRSPHAHARLCGVDAGAALAMPGVLAVFTGADLEADGIGHVPALTRHPVYGLRNADGSAMPDPPRHLLVRDKARHVGDPVAMVIAETEAAARDAAEAVQVDWQPLPAVVDPEAALASDAPRLWEDLPGNHSFEWCAGDAEAVAAACAKAAHVIDLRVVQNRLISVPLEPRTALGEYDPASGRYTLTTGCQSVHQVRWLVAGILGVAESGLRVLAPDTGGGFGTRGPVYPEQPLVCWAAKRLGRPVRWCAGRVECFLTDAPGRDHRLHGRLAVDADGRFLALDVDTLWNHGAYLSPRALFVAVTSMAPIICGPYAITASRFRIRGVFTNTAGIHAFRGVARAEAAYLLERLVDETARVTGLDRVDVRRRNLVPRERMPWRTPAGATLADADFDATLEHALSLSAWAGIEERRAAAATRGRLRGIGLALTVESTGGVPREFADVEWTAAGDVVLRVGTRNFGMGHETVYAQLLADRLGIEPARVRVIDDDSDAVREGAGSHGSRSMRMGGGAIVRAVEALLAAGRPLAATLLQADAGRLVFADGVYTAPGGGEVALATVASAAAERGVPLRASGVFESSGPVFANGCQVCEVEVDPDTGVVALLAHSVVHDVGRAVNPMLVEGQIHGGAVHGIAQALYDHVVHDPHSGQLLTASLMDYRLPLAQDLPPLAVQVQETAAGDNPLGAKGVGEGPTVCATPAVVSAVLDALSVRGVRHLDMPLTPLRVWQALRDAGA